MSLDEQIKAALIATPGANALIALVAARVYPISAPESNTTFPLVVWNELSIEPSATLDTFGSDAMFITQQFHCWAATIAEAKAVRSALATALAAYTDFASASAQQGPGAYLDDASRKCNAPLNVRFFASPVS